MEFIRLSSFEKTARAVFTETELLELELHLLFFPTAGDVIPGGKGLRKLRRPCGRRGKRGGARVIYYFLSRDEKILLVLAYAKNRQRDITRAQTAQLIFLVQKELS